MARDMIVGPESGPESPFPVNVHGRIVKGFGRGSKEIQLGIPTANLPIEGLAVGGNADLESGVYYGWASICLDGAVRAEDAAGPVKPNDDGTSNTHPSTSARKTSASHKDFTVYPAVLSIGYNPFYKNKVRSVEIHVMHKFESDFYNAMLNLSILGFIRHELDYESLEKLVEDINTDIEVARRSLNRESYEQRKDDDYLKDFSWD